MCLVWGSSGSSGGSGDGDEGVAAFNRSMVYSVAYVCKLHFGIRFSFGLGSARMCSYRNCILMNIFPLFISIHRRRG